MDHKALAFEAWSVTRRTPALWWLGSVSAAQVLVYSAIVASVTGPLAVMPQLLTAPSASPTLAESQMQILRGNALVAVTGWLSLHGTALLVGIVAVFVLWIALGVIDVAAQGGLISQACSATVSASTSAAARERHPSLRDGMRDGFRVWGRIVGLLAIAALPSLIPMLVVGLVATFTMTVPLLLGGAPNPRAAIMGNLVLSPLSSLAALVSIPLGVAVQLGLREAVLVDANWRTAFSAGGRLLKAHLGDVAVAYLLVTIVGVAVTLLAGIVLAVLVVPTIAVAFAVGGGSGPTAITSGLFVLSAVSLIVLFPLAVLTYVWTSCFWTMLWQRLTAADGARATMTGGRSTTEN